MEKILKFSTILALSTAISCGGTGVSDATNDNGDYNSPAAAPELTNGGFENGLTGWTVSGGVSASQQACIGRGSLMLEGKGISDAFQEISAVEAGVYDLRFYYKKSKDYTGDCRVSVMAKDGSSRSFALASSPDSWTEGVVRGVRIDGSCTVKIICEAEEGGWCQIDGLSFRNSAGEFRLLKGGDISELTLVEREGGKYYVDGQERECLSILKDGGFNIVRLRLYNDPGNPDYSPSSQIPTGIQDEEDILKLAKRAKDAGMEIELTFHYSDSWTNGGDQHKPHLWADMGFAELKQAVHDFTADFLDKMAAQGTLPEYVSLGNETQAGMLYPDGDIVNKPTQLCELYNAGASAVREKAPQAKIIIHSDAAGDSEKYNWGFGVLESGQVDYDMIGASYYPFWEQYDVDHIIDWAKNISSRFDKDIMIMECGYAWNPKLPDGGNPQISHNLPYTEMTPLGQKNFMLELFSKIQLNPQARIAGVLYWDPIFIEAGDAGWAVGEDNVVSNTTLFDFQGNALPVFDAFKYNE